MKRLFMIAGAVCVAAAVWLYNVMPQSATSPPTPDSSGPMPAVDTRSDPRDREGTLAIDGNVVTDSFDDGTEVVLGLRVRKDRDCKVELKDYVTTDGEMFSAYTCTPFQPKAEHPYAHYTDDALETLAYADADAAAQLGQRVARENRDKAYELLLRATALDGNVRHLAWLADAYYGRYRVDGELQVENVMRQYEIAAIAAHFGEDSAAPALLKEELEQAGVGNEELTRLDERVAEVLGQIREIQFTVYGEVRHGGRSDA